MLDQLLDWCDGREIDRVVTYNGAWFDLKHIGTWARQFEDERTLSGRYPELSSLFDIHVDLAKAAADHYSDELWEEQEVLPDWKVYQLTGIDNESVWYEDYEFNDAYFDGLGIDSKHVKGEHVGQVLGEQYVDGITHGLQHTNTHQELKRLLRDYAESDVADLLILYDRLGGEDLIDEYQYPLETIVD